MSEKRLECERHGGSIIQGNVSIDVLMEGDPGAECTCGRDDKPNVMVVLPGADRDAVDRVEVEFSDRTHEPGDKESGTMRGEIRFHLDEEE